MNTAIARTNETLRRHSMIVNGLDGLDRQVEELTQQLAADERRQRRHATRLPAGPAATVVETRAAGERDTAIDRLRAWVEQIYRPGYGQIAATLPPCWERHTLCLYTLDWLSELWSLLYLAPERTAATLAAQAEWQTRLLPAAAEQMALEATRCSHSTTNPRRPDGPGCP